MVTDKNIKNLFETFDANKDGMIDIKEFQSALPTSHRQTVQNVEGQGSQSRSATKQLSTLNTYGAEDSMVSAEEMFEQNMRMDDAKWKALIAMADKDGDGKVSLEEFTQSLREFIDQPMH